MPPNIVIINPDQMRWDYTTHAGHPFIDTANMNRLAAMGTTFTQAYTACPMCGPSRAAFVTGRYPAEHGVRDYGGTMDPAQANALTSLGAAGYHRALFGKDHIVPMDAIGVLYDEGEDICIGNMDIHPAYRYSWSSGPLEADSPWNLTERLTTAALDCIARRGQTDTPFFVTINYQDPHPYFTCPEPYASLFTPDQFALPENFRRNPAPGEPKRLSIWREHSQSLAATEDDFRRAMAMYCGQIRYVDDQVGRVLDTLERLALLDNTLVFFWSDHGELLGDFGVTHKLPAFYESLVHVPALLWDPTGRLPRGRCSHPVECMDLMATILDICGVPQPTGSHAWSLLRDEYAPRVDIYAEGGVYRQPPTAPIPGLHLKAPSAPTQFGPGAMLRTDEWKLVLYAHDQGELYQVTQDPHECHNRYDDPACAEIRQQLQTRMIQRQLCLGQAPEHLQ